MEELLDFAIHVFVWAMFFRIVLAVFEFMHTKKELVQAREELKEKIIKRIHYISQEKHGECY